MPFVTPRRQHLFHLKVPLAGIPTSTLTRVRWKLLDHFGLSRIRRGVSMALAIRSQRVPDGEFPSLTLYQKPRRTYSVLCLKTEILRQFITSITNFQNN